MKKVYINGYQLVRTCYACPEQYDVFFPTGEQLGYLRLRHGSFRANLYDVGGKEVYSTCTEGDGIFVEHERVKHLRNAIQELEAAHIIEVNKQLDQPFIY